VAYCPAIIFRAALSEFGSCNYINTVLYMLLLLYRNRCLIMLTGTSTLRSYGSRSSAT